MHINNERLIATFINLLKIKSPSKNEEEIINYISKVLKNIGLRVEVDKAGKKFGSNTGNLIAVYENKNTENGKSIFLNAHVDTVKLNGDVIPEIVDGKIINKNKECILGGDDKVAVAAIIEALRVIKENNIKVPVIYLIFTISEEIGLKGAKNLDTKKIKADIGFTFDADGDVGTIITKAPYHNSIKMFFKGKAAHAGIEPEKGINSIKMASEYISGIDFGKIDFETTSNIGVIKGGSATNIVPDSTEIEMEVRSRNLEKLNKATGNLLERSEEIADKYKSKVNYELSREYDGFEIAEDQLPLKIAKKAISSLGIKPVVKETGGGSDVNMFNSGDKMAVNLTSGMEKVHTSEEYVKLEQLKILSKLIIQICKLARKN